MRCVWILTLAACPLGPALRAQVCTIALHAPKDVNAQVALYRYDDLFTLRTVRLDRGVVGSDGRLTLQAEVSGTVKALLMVGEHSADLFLRPGAAYRIDVPHDGPRQPRTLAGTARFTPVFNDLDPLDINALISDLNERLDAFIAEDLATDQVAGMQAAEVLRRVGSDTVRTDTVQRPSTLFLTPTWSEVRVDTFTARMRRFYAGVDDPWFDRSLEMGLASLRLGPQANLVKLHAAHLGGRPPDYEVPEYVRFFRSFFEDHLDRYPLRNNRYTFLERVKQGERVDSLSSLLSGFEPLRSDDQLRELVLIDQLYLAYPGKLFDKGGILRVLGQVAERSAYPEHRRIATNMLHELTAMAPGSTLPDINLIDRRDDRILLDTLLQGPVLLAITASWCTWCEAELTALAKLRKDHGDVVRYVVVTLDRDEAALHKHLKDHPARDMTWCRVEDPLAVRDALRCRTVPTFLLLDGRTLVQSPAPWPSQGLSAVLHRMRVDADERDRIKFGGDRPPPPKPKAP